MMARLTKFVLAFLAAAVGIGHAHPAADVATTPATCPTVLKPSYPAPVLSSGWSAQLVVKGLVNPRTIVVDSKGALLVLQQGKGVQHLTFTDYGETCLVLKKSTLLIDNKLLNHGLALSADGKTLYASSHDMVFAWAYDAVAVKVSASFQTIVNGMAQGGHLTRTLVVSKKQPDLLLVSRGSDGNIDNGARDKSTGHSTIKAFNLTTVPNGGYKHASQGLLVGWGLRNSVGVCEHPTSGGIFSVENSADQVKRLGIDIHLDNPGEELNFHGSLAKGSSTALLGKNYGYPDCLAAWGVGILPINLGISVGTQFAGAQTKLGITDAKCKSDYIAPTLTFQAHMAPLDIKFTPDGKTGFVSFHGSWNRDKPVGYKLCAIPFNNGKPVAGPSSTTATVDIMSNANNAACPDKCFRPVGICLDVKGRVFLSSDKTGEIYILKKGQVSIGSRSEGDGGVES